MELPVFLATAHKKGNEENRKEEDLENVSHMIEKERKRSFAVNGVLRERCKIPKKVFLF